MAYSLAKSLRATAAEHLEFTGDDNIGFTWVGNVDKSGDWKKTYRGDLAMTGKENPYGSAQVGGTNYQRGRPDTSDDDDDESDYGNRRGNRLGATCGSSHEGPYGVSKRQGNPDILGATNTSSGWRSSGRNPYDNRLPMETSDRQKLGSTNIIPSFDKQNFRKTKFGSSGQNLRVTRNPYGITQLSILPEESERGPPAGSRPYDDTYPAELGGIATGAYDRKDGWKTMLANRNITDQIYRQFDQIKRRWAPSSGLSETGSVKKWDEQSTDTSSSETRSGCFSDSDDYDHKSLKKRCLVGFIILFVILVLAAAIVPAVVLTLKKDSGDSPDVMERIDMQAKINNFNFTPGLNDNTSDEYYNFTHTFCDEINATMAENNKADGLVKDLFGCTVQSLSSGSVNVKFTVVIIHGGNNGPPTETQVKILVGVGDRNTGTVSIGIFTIDVETFVVQAIVVVTAENSPLPTMISYDGICQPKDECETSFARCLDGKCACAQNRYYDSEGNSCLKVDCGQKPTVTHGATATSEGALYGSILKVTCDEGYALPSDQDPFNVTCVNNNSWANLPGCSPISCGNYTAQIDNHILGYDPNSFVGSVFNENVTILCVDGYENPAEKTETCQSDGKWTSNVRCTAVSCGSFQAPDHSVIFENGIEYENTVNITCNPGYEIEGESSSTCQANRNWTSYGKCNPILCKTFEVVQNSKNTSIVNDIRFNEPLIILCQDDHVYVGDTSLSCEENGDWPIISCVPVACSGTTYIDNGKISNASETKLIYQCNDGYETDDNTIVECLNGQWDSLPVCTRKNCGQIATLMNGNIIYVNGTFFGDTAVVECDIGYELSKEDIIQCQSNSTWNYRPSCDKVYCDSFPPHAVKSSSTGYRFGDSVEITCERGYNVIANISKCQSNKSWLPNSVCQIQDCGNILIENGQIQGEANTTFGSMIFVACDVGFSIIGKENVSCLETGEWDALPICSQSDCGKLILPEQAYVNGSIVECTDGFTLVGNSDIKCHSNGTWEPVGECNPVSCGTPVAPLNGAFENETVSFMFQDILTVVCHEGYQHDGSESIECLSSGTWSDIAECAPVTCSPFTLPMNSDFIGKNDESKSTFMSNISIKCLIGYEMKGNANVTCQSNGTWTVSPKCVQVMCENYTLPRNAHIAEGESPDNYFNESITVMCDLGYTYADSALTTDVCQANKTWTSQVFCEPVSCEPFNKTILNAELSQNGNTYGDNITVTCQTGYVLEGSETIECTADRSWSDDPTCAPINCTTLSEVLSENVEIPEGGSKLFSYGDAVELDCKKGYETNSSTSVSCQADRNWSHLPACRPVMCQNYTVPPNAHIAEGESTDKYFNSSITVICDLGYEYADSSLTTDICQANKTWTSHVSCGPVSCGTFDTPTNSVISEDGIKYENTVNITCNPGYEIEGESSSTCQANRNWTNVGTCNSILCKDFEVVANSKNTSIVTGVRFNEQITIQCLDGYIYAGNSFLECNENGDWPEISCLLVACNGTTHIDNGILLDENETALSYQCNDGYETDDSTIVECLNGQWDSLPVCTRKNCGQIATLLNGNITYVNGTFFGDTAVVECDIGYELSQENIIQCQSSGAWNYIPFCDKVYCDSFPPHAVKSSSTGYRFGDRVEITCENGYRVIENISECQSNKRWVPDSVCQIQDCGNISIENGQILDEANTTFGSMIFVACQDGFSIIGKEHVSCLETGEWEALPICVQSDCGNLTLPEQAYANGSIVQCTDGYTLKGNSDIKCHSNGTWEPVGDCMPISCNAIDAPLNGDIENKTSSHVFQTKLTVMCNEGYQLNGSESIECLSSGKWSVIAECAPVTCLPFTLPNKSNCIDVNDQSKNTYMSNITIKCLTGYEMKGNANVTCQSNGTWTIFPECVPVMCKNYTVPPNAHIAEGESPDNYFDESITVMCDLGYEYTDSALTTDVCQSNKNWTTQVSCEPVSCGALTIENAEMSQDGSNYGDNITVTCNTGYVLKGAEIIQCAENRSWSSAPTCEPINCTQLSEILPKNVAISVGSTNPFSFNDTVELVCMEGYEANSSTSVTCQADGNWTPFPECEAVSCGAFGETIMNAEMSQDGSSYGDNITVTCSTGYVLEGSGIIQCGADKSWSDAPSCAPINCTHLSEILPENLAISEGSGILFHYNITFDLACGVGYIINGTRSVTCQANGTWTNLPICNAIKCVKFNPPEFGDIDESFYVGQYLKENVTIKCQDGFKIEDPTISTAECQSNGTWTTRVKCVKINCGEHEQVTNGNLDGSDDDFNSTTTISCDPGYALLGSNLSTCQANKTWTEIGQCLPITCNNFDVVENSQNRSTIRDIKYGQDIDILCNDGFVYVGKKPLTCSENGDWPVVNCSSVTCNGSTDIDHGFIVNTTATAIEFKCQDGYESLSGLIVQCIDGEWGTLPNCTKVDCGQIQDIDNGSVIYINKTTLFGDTAVVNCSFGYEPLETQEITCQSNGSWSHYQTCALIRCPSVLGSYIYIVNSTANYSFKDSATVACAAGYTLDGSNVIECKVDGNWTDIPTCSLIDCSSPIIANGNVTFNTTSNGSTATVICDYGYMHDGNGSALCENGTWLGMGSCEKITCNPFMPQKNMRTQNDSNGEIYPFNSVIQVECDEGYQFTTNDTTLTCDLTGNWTDHPECEIIMCTIQNVSNGRPNPDKVKFFIGDSYNLTCDEGYDLLDESNVTCDENGIWNKQLSCEPVNCTSDISLENGTFSPSKPFYLFGNEVSINCNEGYKIEGSSEIQCLANGSWSHLPSCTLITCGNISVSENAEIVDDGGNTFGSNKTIKCKPGFYLTGSNMSMCMDNENWLELGNCTLIECGMIPLINNTRNISANFTTQYNSSISYECNEGYNFSNESDAQIVCSQNGMWEGSITCQKVKCLKLNIGNGSISEETNDFGDIVKVQCNDNYTLTGNSEVRCLANGSWDDVPICEKVVVCPTLTITNGNINFTDGLANVTCFDLYSLDGSSYVDCQQNGSWTEIPRCDLAFCQPLTIEHGYINDTQTEIGSVVHVSCKGGYEVNGTSIITCETDGNWSAEVVCELMSCISFDVNEGGLFTVDNKTAPFNGSIIPTCIPGTVFTPGSVREINCTENGWIGVPECEIQGQISFERNTFSFPSGKEAIIKCSISNNTNWQHAVMKKMNETIFSVWNDTGSVRVTDETSIHRYTAFHSMESTFEFGLNISSIICEDAGVYICEVEAGNFTSVKSANASVSLTGTATIPNISAPEFMNAGHGGEIKCTGNIGFNENGLTGNLSLFVTTVEQSIPVSEINQQCDGYAEAVFMVPGFPNNITEVTVRCETSTVEGSPLVSSNRTIEIRSSYVAFPVSSYLLKIGQPGSIVCDVANIVNWTAVVISKPGDADFIEVFSNGTNNLQNGSNIDLSNSNLTDRAVNVVVNFNNVTCSDAAMESGTINYTCTARNGDALLGQDTTKITFQRPPGLPILTMAERVYERSDSFGGQEFSCKGNVGSPPGEIYVESTFMDDSEIFQTFLTYDDTTKVDTSYGWVNVGPLNTTVACGVEVEIKFALREPPLSLHRKKLRCVIKPSTEIVNEESVYSDVGIILVVPESVCESEAAQKKVEHPYTCHTFVQCSERKFAYAALTGCREDECYNESHTQACTNCTCQKRARTIDGFACEVATIEVSLDNSANTACSLEGITTVNEIEISKDGQLYNLTSVGQSSFTGKLGKMDAQVDLTAKTASFSIVNVSCEDEGSYLIKIDSLSEEIIVEVSSQPKQPEISVPVSSYVNQEMTVQCIGYVGRKSQEAATRLQLQTHDADETEFIVYGVFPTNQSMECSDTTCECYETLIFSIFPTLSKNNSVVRCAALTSDGSVVVSSEVKILNLVQGDIYFFGEDVTTAIGRSISLGCVLSNGLGANGAIVHFNSNYSAGDTELCVVSQSGAGNCTVDGIWAYATNIDSSVTVNVTIGNISCSNVGRYTCTSITTSASAASINLDAFELPTAPTLKLSRQIIDGQGTWGDRLFYCSGELGPEGALTIELTKNGTFVPLLSVNDTDNDVAFILTDKVTQYTSTCNNEVTIPFAFKAAYVNSEFHGKRLRCKTSPSAGLGLDVLYSNEEEIKVVNSSYCEGKENGFHVHPFYCSLYIQCGSNKIVGMLACQDNYCWDASDTQCKPCDQLVVECQVDVTTTTTTPDPLSEQLNCFPKKIYVFNGTRPDDIYCSLENVEQINNLNISKDGNLLSGIESPTGLISFGQFISLSPNTGAINVTFGTASCEDEGEYLIELNNGTMAEFSVLVVSNAEIPILSVTSTPKLNQILKMTCTAILGRGQGGTERTQVVLQRRKNDEPFEEYVATHMSDCSTSPCVCFVEAEYSVLLTDSWNETDVRCALKNTSTNVIEEDLTSSESRIILGDTEMYFTDVNKSATIGTRVELICKLQIGQGDQGVNITRTSDNLNCAVNGSGDQIHCAMGYLVSSETLGDHQVVRFTIESMGCIDGSEYRCTAVKDPLTYASLRLEAQAEPKVPILSIPLTTVENIPTPYTALDYLWCLANIGSDTNRAVQIEIQRSGESEFSAFNLKTPEIPETTSENCEINVTVTYKQINFDNSYNNSKIRCSVYQNASSTDPMVSSPVYDATLLPGSVCDEVTNTTLYLPYPYSYPGSCQKYVQCSYGGTFVSIYTRECSSTLCPVFVDNGKSFYCGSCNGCI